MRWIRVSLILFLSSPLWAQHTTVTATVVDPNGTPYVNCSGSANFIGQNNTPGAGPYTLGGGSFQTVVPIFCDSFGAFTVSLASNNVVTPTPSQWRFTITSATGYVPGNTYSFNTLITITGLTQDVSASLQAAAAVLPTGGGGPSNVRWNALQAPQANLSLNTSLFTTTFTAGDFGVAPVPGIWNITDFSVSSTDTSTNFHVGTANNSFHQPFLVDLTTGGQAFAQFQVCNLGTGHVGITVIGNTLPCLPSGSYPGLPGNTGVTGVAKLTVDDNSGQHTSIRAFQNNIVGTGGTLADIVQVNTAATYAPGTLTFNMQTWCTGATQYVAGSSFGNGTCGGSFPGTVLGFIRGDGTASFVNYIGPVFGVSFSVPPSSATGYVCVLISQTACTWQAQSGGGGGGTGTQYQSAAFSATNVITGFGPGLPGQVAVSRGNTNVPIYASAGVAGGNGGTGIVSTNTYTIKCDDPTTGTLDRVTSILFTFSGTVTATLPAPSVSGCGTNFTIKIGASTGTTVNLTSAATLVTLDGVSVGSSLSLTVGQYASINSPDNTVYHVWKTYGIGPNLIVTGTLDGKAPVTVTTGSTASLGGSFSSGYTFNQEATAATAITYTLPTAAAGKQYCVSNSYNGSAATTGTLKVQTSASGQFVIDASGTLSASGGYVISSGVAADAACFVGVDATHWQQYTNRGSWTTH